MKVMLKRTLLLALIVLMVTTMVVIGISAETPDLTITDEAGLKAFRDEVNGGNTYEGKLVVLDADITLTEEWTPIGNGSRSSKTYAGNAFKGTFDGQDHTITGVTVKTTGDQAAGLFGVVDGGTVQNVKLANVAIGVDSGSSENAGAAIGLMVNNATAKSISVLSGSVTGPDGIGGVVGRMIVSGTISDCTNAASVTATTTACGGIVGKANYTELDKVMNITNCVNSGVVNAPYAAGGVVGLSAANVSNCTNNGAVSALGAGDGAGGIVGQAVSYGIISGNSNSGTITAAARVGGIVGKIRYESVANYPLTSAIQVLNNTNSGTIVNTSTATIDTCSGGIVGMIDDNAIINGNENTAETISGGAFAGGVVGHSHINTTNPVDNEAIKIMNNVSSTTEENITANTSTTLYAPDKYTVSDNAVEWGAQIGETKYATVNYAFTQAQEGDEIIALTDAAKAEMVSGNVGDGLFVLDNRDGTFSTVAFDDVMVLPSGMTQATYAAAFGDNTVTDGNGNYWATMQAALKAIHNADTGMTVDTLYCKPGANVGQLNHDHVCGSLTVYGNDAYVPAGGEKDFEIGMPQASGTACTNGITADMTLKVIMLDGAAAWGTRNVDHTVNIVFEKCNNMHKVYLTGTVGTTNISLTDCSFDANDSELASLYCAVYSNSNGAITISDCTFTGVTEPVNLNHKAASGVQTVTISDCTFDACGGTSDYQAPVRVTSLFAGGETKLTVTNTTFINTVENTVNGTADILLDSGAGETVAAVTSTTANVVKETDEGHTSTEITEDETFIDNAVAEADGVYFRTLADAVAYATNTTITLLSDITDPNLLVEGGAVTKPNSSTPCYIFIAEDKTITLDLNGYKIAVADPGTVKNFALITNRGVLTINDSSDAKTGAILFTTVTTQHDQNSIVLENRGGTLTINGGTIEHQGDNGSPYLTYAVQNNTNTAGDSTLIINGGTIKSTGVAIRLYTTSPTAQAGSGSAYFTMTGGSVSGGTVGIWLQNTNSDWYGDTAQATVTISGGTITTESDDGWAYTADSHNNADSLSTTISGGTFNGVVRAKDDQIAISDGIFNGDILIKTYDENGTKVDATSSDAISGGTFNAGVNPNYLATSADTLLTVCVTAADGSATVYSFDTIEAAFAALATVDASAIINVSFCDDLTLTDTLVLDRDMTVNGGGHTISSAVASATVTVNANVTLANVTIINMVENGAAIALGTGATLHAEPTTVLTAAVPFSGYTVGQVITTTDEALANALNAAGYALTAATVDEVTTYTVVTNAPKATLNGWHYDTFANALDDARDGDIIALLENLTVDQAIVIARDITIDGNNYTITSNATGAMFTLNASLVLDNVAIINNVVDVPAFALANDAGLTIEGNCSLSSSPILSGYDEVGHTHEVSVGNAALAQLLETEGYFMVPNGAYYTISDHSAAKIGNTLYETLADALYAAVNGDTIIILKNIELAETVAIDKRITIYGHFTLLTSTNDTAVFSLGENASLTINCAIEKADGAKVLAAWAGQTVKTDNVDVRDMLNAEGYAMVEESTGVWTVKAAKASIGSMNYASLADALAAVQNNETIVLKTNAELTAPAIIDKTITIDCGTYTITSSASTTFVVSGNLTVNGATVNTYVTGSMFTLSNGATVAINGTVTATKVLVGYDKTLHTVTTTVQATADKLNGEGYALVKSGAVWTVMTDKPEAMDANGWHYVTVEDAIAAGGTITLLCDVTVEATINVTGDLVIAGNYTLTSTAATAFKLNDGATLALNCKLEAADILDINGGYSVTTTVKAIAEQLNAEHAGTFTKGSGENEKTFNLGYALVLNGGVYTVTTNYPEAAVDGWNVATLKGALDTATKGQTVVLLRDINTAEAAMNIVSDITLDGNGMKITSAAPDKGAGLRVVDANATIKNLTLETTNALTDAFVIKHVSGTAASVIWMDSTIISQHYGIYLYQTKTADVTIINSTITAGHNGVYVNTTTGDGDNNITLTDTTITTGASGVYSTVSKKVNVTLAGNTSITVTDTYNSEYGRGVHFWRTSGTVIVKDNVTITSQKHGIVAYGSAMALTVQGNATITTKANGAIDIENGVSDSTTYKDSGSSITVTGTPTLNGANYDIYTVADASNVPVSVSGVTSYAAVHNCVRNGGQRVWFFHNTLADALGVKPAYTDGVNTVTLLKNITGFEGTTVVFPCIIDGNGYSITVADGKTAFTLGADCTSLALNNVSINGNILAGFAAGKTVTTNMESVANALNVQGYALHKEGDIWTVAGLGVVSLNGWNYATIQEALGLIKNGESLNVLIDFSTNTGIVIDKSITIYGNDKKISSTATPAITISNTVTMNDLTLYATGVGIKTANGPVDPIVITLNDCTIGDSAKPIGSHGIQFQYLSVDVTLFMTNSTVYAVGRGVQSDMSNARTVNITIKMDTLDTTNPTICSTGGNGLSFHYANDVNVTLENVYIKAKDTAFGASQHNQNNADNPKVVVANATNCKFESTNGTAVGMNMDKGNVNNRFIADITLTNCTISGVTYGVILDGSTTEHGASKLTISGGSVSCTATGIHLRGDVTASISNISVTSTNSWAIYTEQTSDTANTVPYINLTVTNCTLSGLGGIRFSAVADATRGNSKLTISGGSVSCTETGIHLSGDVTASISNVSVTSTNDWAIYTEQTSDTANTVPYFDLTVTNCTLSGLGGIRFSATADATRGNSKLTISGGTITANGKHNAAYSGSEDKTNYDDKPTYAGILISGAADVAVSNATISAPSTTGIHFWQGCTSANLTLTNTHVGTADKLIGRLGIYVYQSNAAEVNITLINSTVAATNIAIKVNGKAAQTANFTVTNDALDSENPTLYSRDTHAISANWACDLHVALTNAYLKSKDTAIHLTQHNTNLTSKDPKILSGTITGCLIVSENGNAINVYTADTTDAAKKPMYGLQLTVTDSTLKAKNTAVLLSAYEGLEGNYLNLNGNTRLEGDYGLFLRGVGGNITVTATKSDAGSLTIVATTYAIYMDSTIGVTFTADGGSITSTKNTAIYRSKNSSTDIVTQLTLTDVAISSQTKWAIDLMDNAYAINSHKVDVTLTRCTITGAYGVNVGGYELGTDDNKSGYALQITGGSINTTNDALSLRGIYAIVKNATLTTSANATSTRAVYMQSNADNAPKLVLDNTTLTYLKSKDAAIYLANDGYNTVILQNNSRIVSSADGIRVGWETMYNNTITLIDSTIEAAKSGIVSASVVKGTITINVTNSTIWGKGLYAIQFNASSYQEGKLVLNLNGGTIKTTASVADDVAAAQNVLPHAIFIREGIVEITSPENSAKNYILAEGNRGIAIFFDQYAGNIDMTLYNTEIKADHIAITFGSQAAVMGSDLLYNSKDATITAVLNLNNVVITSATNTAIFLNGSAKSNVTINMTGTDVTAKSHAIYVIGNGIFALNALDGAESSITSTDGMGIFADMTDNAEVSAILYDTAISAKSEGIYLYGYKSKKFTLKMTDCSISVSGTADAATNKDSSRGIYLVGNALTEVVLTDTTVRAKNAAIELCIWSNGHADLTIKMTDTDLSGRTDANADIYSELYRAINLRSGASYTLDLDNVSVYGGTQAIYRTRPDGTFNIIAKFIATFDNCDLASTGTSWVLWAGDAVPSTTTGDSPTSWVVELTFTDCTLEGGGGIIVTSRHNQKSTLKMTDCTVDANTTIGIAIAGYFEMELTRVDVKAYKNKASNNTGAIRIQDPSTTANVSLTDVRIWNYGVGSGSNYPTAIAVTDGENHLKAHNLELYAEGKGGRGLEWQGIQTPTGKNDNSVEITGKLVIRSVEQCIIFNPKSGGTLKIHLDGGDGRTKTTPDIKSTNNYGIHLNNHTNKSLETVFELDLKNVYLESKGNGIHRSADACTLTGTIDQCKFVSTTAMAFYFNNNGIGGPCKFTVTIQNTIGNGKTRGMNVSGKLDAGSKITLTNVNLYGEDYGVSAQGHVEFEITGSHISAGVENTLTDGEKAAFRTSIGESSVNVTAKDTTFAIYSYGKLTTWDSNGDKAGGWVTSLGATGAKAIYASNGDFYMTLDNCRIYANGRYGVGIQRGGENGYGEEGGAHTVITLKNGTVIEAEFTAINFAEDYKNYTKKLEIKLEDVSATVQRGLVFRLNGTNANTRNASLTIKDSVLTSYGVAFVNNDETDQAEKDYRIYTICVTDSNFKLNISGDKTRINAPNHNAIYMIADAAKIAFNMTGGVINAKTEAIELQSGAGGFDFDMTGGRIVAGKYTIRLRPGSGTNTVDINMAALNTTTPDIELTQTGGYGFYIHNAESVTINLTNVYIRATEGVLCKTDPNDPRYCTLTVNGTNSKLETVGTGYTIFRIADDASRKSYIISQITLTDCEMINSAQRSDGSAHGFRIDAAEGSFLKIYGGSLSVPHTAFRFREWVDVTIDVSPNTGAGTQIDADKYLFDTANNDTFALPADVTELNYTQSIYVEGATMSSDLLGFNIWHSANRNISLLTITLIETELTTAGNAFQIGYDQSFKGDMVFYIEDTDIVSGNNAFRLIKEDKTLTGDLTITMIDSSIDTTNYGFLINKIVGDTKLTLTNCDITSTNAVMMKTLTGACTVMMTDTTLTGSENTIFVTELKGKGALTLTNCELTATNAEGIRWYTPITGVTQALTLRNTTISAGTTAINPDCHGDLVLRITADKAYGSTPTIVSTGAGEKDHHGIHFQSGGKVEFYMENVYIKAKNTGIYRSSNDNVMIGTMKNSKLEGDSCCMRICWDNSNERTVTWYAENSEYVGEVRLANNRVCSYNFDGCTFYNEDGNALILSSQGEVNLTDCVITSETDHAIFVDNGTIGNTDFVLNITNSTLNAKKNAILVDPDLLVVINLRNVTAISGEATVYMNGSAGSVLNIAGGIFENNGTAGYIIDILGEVVANIYGGYFHTTNEGALRARDYAVMNVYGGYYEMTENTHHSKYTAMIRLGTDKCAGRAIVNVYGGTFVAPEDLYSMFCINRGRAINLYAFNAIGAQYILVKNNAAKVDMEYPTDVHEFRSNSPVMVDGAQVRLVLSEDKAGGIRFVSNIDVATIDYAKWLADDPNSISFGTVIAPLDYIHKLPAFTVDLLKAADLPYLDIVAKNGLILNEDGSVTLRAVISEIKEQNYDRVFAAIAYVKVSVNGEDVYLYSIFDEEANSRSLKQLAERALADVTDFQTSAYRFEVGDGTYSRYTADQRAALTRIVNCQYDEEVIIEPTATTPGLKKVWCDSCGTYYEVLIPAGTPVSVGNDD